MKLGFDLGAGYCYILVVGHGLNGTRYCTATVMDIGERGNGNGKGINLLLIITIACMMLVNVAWQEGVRVRYGVGAVVGTWSVLPYLSVYEKTDRTCCNGVWYCECNW